MTGVDLRSSFAETALPSTETVESGPAKAFTVSWRLSLACLVGGLALGELIVLIERAGVQKRPLFGAVVLLGGLVAGMLPLRFGVFAVVVACAYQGFLINFVGSPGLYWKEAFVAVVVFRALRKRLPTAGEIAAVLLTAGVFIAYTLFNHALTEVAWGAKILLLFAAGGWALCILRIGPREWQAGYAGLMVVVSSSFIVAQWQRNMGVGGLLGLGFTYGDSVRQVGNTLRVFAGFIYGAPFAYTMALAALCWFALYLSKPASSALRTVWVPALAAVGIVWSLSRIALVGMVVACAVVTLMQKRLHAAFPVAVVLAGVVVFASGSAVGFLGQGFTFSSQSAKARTSLWKERWAEVNVFGGGPGSAGAAFARAADSSNSPQNAGERVTDNLYVSWLLQYGILLGIPLCLAWLALLSRPLFLPGADPAIMTARLFGVFAIVAAFAVNVWEEFPVNLVLALFITQAFSSRSEKSLAEAEPSVAPL
jgi:hypothetical protein